MKIQYRKKTLRVYLIFAIIFIILSIIQLCFLERKNLFSAIGWPIISFGWIGLFLYNYYLGYLTIKDGFIINNSFFRKKIKLSDIKEVKRFCEDYIIKTDKKEMTVNTKIINPNSLEKLNAELEKLDVKWV